MTYILTKSQQACVDRVRNVILPSYKGFINTGTLGSGKTIASLVIAKEKKHPVFVVCPRGAKAMWKQKCEEMGIRAIMIISYESLRSTKNHQPKHGYLERVENDNLPKKQRTTFVITEMFRKIVKQGVFLIIDEAQLINNESIQFKAVTAMTNQINETQSSSFFCLLTGVMTDKKESVINYMKILGYIKSDKMLSSNRQFVGFQELLDYCREHFDSEKIAEIDGTTSKTKAMIIDQCFRIFVDIVKPKIMVEMSLEIDSGNNDLMLDIKNCIYEHANDDELKELNNATIRMSRIFGFDWKKKEFIRPNVNKKAVKQELMNYEMLMLMIFKRVVERQLTMNKTCKVIVYLNFTNTLKTLGTLLESWKPLVMNGETNDKTRTNYIELFQTSKEHRLLISNLKVGSVSFNLHDTVGDSQRFMFISPTYEIMLLHEATGRIFRHGSKSKGVVRFVFCKTEKRADLILDSLLTKTNILKDLLTQQVKDGIKFPGEYPKCYCDINGVETDFS
jgi:hypothetical protein